MQTLAGCTEYILISQTHPAVEHFVRQKGKKTWTYRLETDLKAEIVIDSVNCKLKLSDIYDRVVFPPKTQPLSLVEEAEAKKTSRSGKKKTR